MTYTLRAAVGEDATVLAEIDSAASAYAWSGTQLAAACATRCATADSAGAECVQVLETGSRLAGFVVYSLVLDEASVLNLAVHPDFQRRGYARTLLRATLDSVSRLGARRCLLEVRASNIAARSLYHSCGFTLDGIRKDYYVSAGGREDALLMSKTLA